MSNSNKLMERRKKVVANGVGVFVSTTAETARGAILTDSDGNKIIDFGGGIGVVNAGHCPPQVVKAIKDQAEKLIHACFHVSTYEPYIELCEKLIDLFPHGAKTKVMLTNTGAESVENAIKIARQATKRPAIICYSEAFHGRSMMGMSLTSRVNYKLNCGPFAPEVYRVDFPNFYRNAGELSEDEFSLQEIQKLEDFFVSHVNHEDVAAIIIEVVQGEGGFNSAPKKYIQELRRVCDEKGIVLIFDEVQSGFCRTGKWAAYEHYNVLPDLSTWAKSMGSGMPIGCVIGKQEVMDAAMPGTIGGTYLGNPVCCAAALATIELMKSTDLNSRAMQVGEIVTKRFNEMASWAPCIGDVRGLGAMIAVEFVEDRKTKAPNKKVCDELVEKCLNRGLLLLKAGSNKNIVRVLSPLVITDEELNEALDIIELSLKETVKGK